MLFILTGCVYDRGIILFSNQPITASNVPTEEHTFNAGERIYYLFIAPKKMDNKYIRVQVFKYKDNAVVRTKDFRLMKDERYYHSDYFVFHEAGIYLMQVFSTDDLQHPLSVGEFHIK